VAAGFVLSFHLKYKGQTENNKKDLTSAKNENETGCGFARKEEGGEEKARVFRVLREESAYDKAALWAHFLQALHGQVDKARIDVPAL